LLPVTLATETRSPSMAEVVPPTSPSGSIHIELPGRAVISIESGVDTSLIWITYDFLRTFDFELELRRLVQAGGARPLGTGDGAN
jgi:hypothetical protein